MKTALVALSLILSGQAAYAGTQDFLAQNGLIGKTPRQIIDEINQPNTTQPLNFSASVTSTELRLTDGKDSVSYPLGDKFYLSFAPYLNQTHPCFNHSLTSCRGELGNTAFNVNITDQTGKVILNRTMTSYRNGFVGVWLPRNITGTLKVTYNGMTASTPIATTSDSQTCVTGLQLVKSA
ncbi:hypothetical protein FCN80_17830 [Martelella alba]|uniref:Periplasmic or exported protein n=2 Tax=Martelella alba TaxID=2590451 RepID=A0ABY2SHI7_9HYPH|nr:hypothetical protein FCN80_17830 [Martelella alba]